MFVILNRCSCGIFILAAVLQLNDPDPLQWVLLYALAAAACLSTEAEGSPNWLPSAVLMLVLLWASVLFPRLQATAVSGVFETFQMKNPAVELWREFGGLMLIGAWMAVLSLRHRWLGAFSGKD